MQHRKVHASDIYKTNINVKNTFQIVCLHNNRKSVDLSYN